MSCVAGARFAVSKTEVWAESKGQALTHTTWKALGSVQSHTHIYQDPEIHFLFVSLRQGLNMYARLLLNSQQPSCFQLSAGATGMYITRGPEIYF